MSKSLIGNGVVDTDDVIKQGYDFVGLKMAGMLKVQEVTHEQDLTIKGDEPYYPPGTIFPLALETDLPAAIKAIAGSPVTLTIVAKDGVAPYTYAWKRASTSVGGDLPTYNIPSVATGNSGNYTCTVTDAEGTKVTSSVCVLSVLDKRAAVTGTLNTAVGIATIFNYPSSVAPTDLTVTANNGGTVSAGNTSVTPTARGVTTVTAKFTGATDTITNTITVTPVVTGKGDVAGKKAGDVIPASDLFTYTNGATSADITGVTGTDVTWNNTAKTLTVAGTLTTPGADINLAFTTASGVTKTGAIRLTSVAAA